MEALPIDKQIMIEKAHCQGDLSADQLHDLLVGTQILSCIGGLLDDGKPRNSCSYFKIYPNGTADSDLVQHFTALKNARHSLPWKIATLVFSLLSLILGVAVYNKPTNESLERTVAEQKEKLKNTNDMNIKLQKQLEKLNNEAENLRRKNANLIKSEDVE